MSLRARSKSPLGKSGRAFVDGLRSSKDHSFGRLIGVTCILVVLTAFAIATLRYSSSPAAILRSLVPRRNASNIAARGVGSHLERRWSSALRKLSALKPGEKAVTFRKALQMWTSGPMPRAVSVLAAGCSPRDVSDAVISPSVLRKSPAVVVDIGANRGWPVTRLALSRKVPVIVSVEPDPRNFRDLAKLKKPRGSTSKYLAYKGAAARSEGKQMMAFHKTRDDFSCFTCLDTSGKKKDVFQEEVNVYTVDNLLLSRSGITKDMPVLLLKTDTQGYEAEVLHGASRLLASGRIHYALVEFDPKLLRERAVALDVIAVLLKNNMQCTHLMFSAPNSSVPQRTAPIFPHSPLATENMELFVDFVIAQGGWTDLFCAKPRPNA